MLLNIEYVKTMYTRKSKLGESHDYYRNKSILVLRCDSCGNVFRREKGTMDPKRANNDFYHVCDKCDIKRFAQEKGVEKRHLWDMPVSSLKKISQL